MKKPIPPPRPSNPAGSSSPPHAKIENRQTKIPQGLRCPRCNCCQLPVYYTRNQADYVFRVRYCTQCSRRLLTRERVD